MHRRRFIEKTLLTSIFGLFVSGVRPAVSDTSSANPGMQALESFNTIVDFMENFEKVTKEDAAELDIAVFEQFEGSLAGISSSVESAITSSGEKGMLFQVFYLANGTGSERLTAILPAGFGQDESDALLKSLLTESRLPDEVLNLNIAEQALPSGFGPPNLSDRSSGIWVENQSGKIFAKLVPNLGDLEKIPRQRWAIYKTSLALSKSKDTIAALKRESDAYRDLAELHKEAAYEKGVADQLKSLVDAQRTSQEKMSQALRQRDEAIEKAKNYKTFSELGQIIGVAAAVANAYNAQIADANVKGAAATSVYNTNVNVVNNVNLQLNVLFKQEFNISDSYLGQEQRSFLDWQL